MENLKQRIERLEGGREIGAVILYVEPGETQEEAWRKHLAKHPEHEKAETVIIVGFSPHLPDPAGEGSSQQSPGSDGKIPEKRQPGTRMIK